MLVLVLPPGRVFWRSSSAPSAPAETNTSAIRVSVDALGRVRLLSRLVDRAKGIFAALTHSFDAFVRPPECCDLRHASRLGRLSSGHIVPAACFPTIGDASNTPEPHLHNILITGKEMADYKFYSF